MRVLPAPELVSLRQRLDSLIGLFAVAGVVGVGDQRRATRVAVPHAGSCRVNQWVRLVQVWRLGMG